MSSADIFLSLLIGFGLIYVGIWRKHYNYRVALFSRNNPVTGVSAVILGVVFLLFGVAIIVQTITVSDV